VFVGDKPGQPMSNGAMLAVRDRMVEAGLIAKGSATPHGMASRKLAPPRRDVCDLHPDDAGAAGGLEVGSG